MQTPNSDKIINVMIVVALQKKKNIYFSGFHDKCSQDMLTRHMLKTNTHKT